MVPNSAGVPDDDEWTLNFEEFSRLRLTSLEYVLERQKKRLKKLALLQEGRDMCDLCQREKENPCLYQDLDLQTHYENIRDTREVEYECCLSRTAKLFNQHAFTSGPPLHHIRLDHDHSDLEQQDVEIGTNRRKLKALEDHNGYCQNAGPADASANMGVIDYHNACSFDCCNPLLSAAWISQKKWSVPDDRSSVRVRPKQTSSGLFVAGDAAQSTVHKSRTDSDSGYTTADNSPVHEGSTQLKSTPNVHVFLPTGHNVKRIRKRQSLGKAAPANTSNPKPVPSNVLARQNFPPKNRKHQTKDNPAPARKGPKKEAEAPVGGEEERRKKIARNKQKALKEKQRRDKSKILLNEVRTFLKEWFSTVLGQKAPHQRVVDSLIKLNPSIDLQEKYAKQLTLKAKRFLRVKKRC